MDELKPYILENNIRKKVYKYIDNNYTNLSFKKLTTEELKSSINNKLLDLNEHNLEVLDSLNDDILLESLTKNIDRYL